MENNEKKKSGFGKRIFRGALLVGATVAVCYEVMVRKGSDVKSVCTWGKNKIQGMKKKAVEVKTEQIREVHESGKQKWNDNRQRN